MLSSVAKRSLRRPLTRSPALTRLFHWSSAWAVRRIVQPFKLADIGEGITECEVIKWNVRPSTSVQLFDPLCEVQSDKASVEITSPFEGVVTELLVKEGEVAKVGENLCMIEVIDESSGEAESVDNANPTAQDSSDVVSSHRPEVQEALSVSSNNASQPHPLDPRALHSERSKHEPSNILALPSVRHFAKEHGVDLALLAPGSGKGGRIEKKDVEAFLARTSSTPSSAASRPIPSGEEVVVELGRTRHAMWKAMVKSLEIPHFGYSTYLDLTTLHKMLSTLNAHIPPHYLLDPPPERPMLVNPSAVHPVPAPPNVPPTGKYNRLTYLPFLLKTLSLAMQEWPLFRSSITPTTTTTTTTASSSVTPPESTSKPTLTIRPHADISIALSTPTGLYTPTLQNVSQHSIYSLASRLAHLSALGRRTPCGLGPEEMPKRGGTLTVSNVGAIGQGEFASPVLVPGGGVAIVAIGRAKWVWEVNDDVDVGGKGRDRDEWLDERRGVKKRLRVGVSWSADHRVVEGAELAAFVECWRGYVENPERLVALGI